MSLHIRISDTDICFARYEAGRADTFRFERYIVRPQASLTVNLREAVAQCDLRSDGDQRVEVHVKGPVTPVPLADFQEEDVERLYAFCFAPGEARRTFYDIVPACNVVALFALPEQTCRILEDTLGHIHYTSATASVVSHFAGKGRSATPTRRIYIYTHDDEIDVAVFEDMRLLALNTYKALGPADVAYYTLNLAHHIGADLTTTPLYIAGDTTRRDAAVAELSQYVTHVYPVNPSADFNRHIIATTPHVPYDMMCALLK